MTYVIKHISFVIYTNSYFDVEMLIPDLPSFVLVLFMRKPQGRCFQFKFNWDLSIIRELLKMILRLGLGINLRSFV